MDEYSVDLKLQLKRIPNPCTVLRIDRGFDAVLWHAKGKFRASGMTRELALKAVYVAAGEVE